MSKTFERKYIGHTKIGGGECKQTADMQVL